MPDNVFIAPYLSQMSDQRLTETLTEYWVVFNELTQTRIPAANQVKIDIVEAIGVYLAEMRARGLHVPPRLSALRDSGGVDRKMIN